LGTAALVLCLLQNRQKGGKKPVVIFAPASLRAKLTFHRH
jgi:hypothetical protein